MLIKAGELRKILKDVPDDTWIVLQNEYEGSNFAPLGYSALRKYHPSSQLVMPFQNGKMTEEQLLSECVDAVVLSVD